MTTLGQPTVPPLQRAQTAECLISISSTTSLVSIPASLGRHPVRKFCHYHCQALHQGLGIHGADSSGEFATRRFSAALAAATCGRTSPDVLSRGASSASTSAAGHVGSASVTVSGTTGKAVARLPEDEDVVVLRGRVTTPVDWSLDAWEGARSGPGRGLIQTVWPRLLPNCSLSGNIQNQLRKSSSPSLGPGRGQPPP